MQKHHKPYLDLTFPVFVIEDRAGEYKIYDIATKQSDFLTFSRVPTARTFNAGYVFDAAGQVYRYESESGWPRFSKGWKNLLEALLLPGPFFKILAYFVYYGPDIRSPEQLELSVFREKVLERLKVYEKGRDAKQLSKALNQAMSYLEVIKAIDWYRFYGGHRDPDGHLLDEKDNS